MSLFSIGGNLGYSLGVIVTTPIVVALGIEGGALVVLPLPRGGGDPAVARAVPPVVRARPGVPRGERLGETTVWARWRCCSESSPSAASPGSG